MYTTLAAASTIANANGPVPGTDLPFWWLDTTFGSLVFILGIVTWGLIIVALALLVLILVRKVVEKRKK